MPNTAGSSFPTESRDPLGDRGSQTRRRGRGDHRAYRPPRVCVRVHLREPVVRRRAEPVGHDYLGRGFIGGFGSSGCSGVTPIAIGTDTGGSVRVPAAMCGVIGLKVTHGRVPLTGVYPLVESLDTVGPTRTVRRGCSPCVLWPWPGTIRSDPWSAVVDVDGPHADRSGEREDRCGRAVAVSPHSKEVADGLARVRTGGVGTPG